MKGRIFLRENKSLQPLSAWNTRQLRVFALSAGFALSLSGCGTQLSPGTETGRHIPAPETAATTAASGIPQVVTPLPLVEPPRPQEEPEVYTVVAQDWPVRDLLFAMARDGGINMDVHPDVSGTVSLNAIDQTLPTILERIANQIDMRWTIDEYGNVVVRADNPEWRTYNVDYVNITRNSTTDAQVVTTIPGGAGSTSSLTQTSSNDFWVTLLANLNILLGTEDGDPEQVISNPESGIVSIRASAREHESIAAFLNSIRTRSLYQVLIEATVVEVNLKDNYQSGVDWATLSRNNGEIDFIQSVTSTELGSSPTNILTIDRSSSPDAITATIAMLSQFGELSVLSSPAEQPVRDAPRSQQRRVFHDRS